MPGKSVKNGSPTGSAATQFRPGNPGRRKGSTNKVSRVAKERISELANDDKLWADFETGLRKHVKDGNINAFLDVLKLVLPKNIDVTSGGEKLPPPIQINVIAGFGDLVAAWLRDGHIDKTMADQARKVLEGGE